MGYEITRFTNVVSKEFICSICLDVFSDPVAIVGCQHIFCRICIMPIVFRAERNKRLCPIDRKPIRKGTEDSPRYFVNLWNDLQIKCKFSDQGCQEVTRLEDLDLHSKNCKFNQIICHGGCGYRGQVGEDHNCIDYLKNLNSNKEDVITSLYNAIEQQKQTIQVLETQLGEEKKKSEPTEPAVTARPEQKLSRFGRVRSSIRKLNCISPGPIH